MLPKYVGTVHLTAFKYSVSASHIPSMDVIFSNINREDCHLLKEIPT